MRLTWFRKGNESWAVELSRSVDPELIAIALGGDFQRAIESDEEEQECDCGECRRPSFGFGKK